MPFDDKLALIAGIDIPIPELQLTLHQPKIKEIAFVGEQDFLMGIQCLSLKKEAAIQDETLLDKITNFQVFMMIMTEQETLSKKESVIKTLSILFPDYKVSIIPKRSLMFLKKDSDPIMVDDSNFEIFQEVLIRTFCLNNNNISQTTFNPKDSKAKEIAEKLMKARQRVAKQNGDLGGSIFSQYVSALTVGLGSMSMEDCLNLTMYQIFDLIERYSLWLNWDLDIKSRLAGGKPDSKPENWMKNIH